MKNYSLIVYHSKIMITAQISILTFVI